MQEQITNLQEKADCWDIYQGGLHQEARSRLGNKYVPEMDKLSLKAITNLADFCGTKRKEGN